MNLQTSSIDFYLSGCKPPHCPGCHNAILFDFDKGTEYRKYINLNMKKLTKRAQHVSNIMIFGGEPLDQDMYELEDMLHTLLCFGKPIWLFTKYSYKEVPYEILKYVSYVKCGRFIQELPSRYIEEYNITVGSSNQKIHSVKKAEVAA